MSTLVNSAITCGHFESNGQPIELANAILRSAFAQHATQVRLEPLAPTANTEHCRLLFKRGKRLIAQAVLPHHLAAPVAARLALMAGLDLVTASAQTARCLVKTGDRVVDLFVTLRHTEATAPPSVELSILDDDAPTAGRDGKPDPDSAQLPNILMPGTLLGPYKVFEVLGRGGMGVVYRGEHLLLRKPCAIKVLHRRVYERRTEATDRFLCEARAAARIHSESIVDVTDVALLPDGRPYLAMELLEGVSLADVVGEGGPFEPTRAVATVREIAQALVDVHAAGIIHRDLSAGNIFLVANKGAHDQRVDGVKLVDFGSAEFIDPSATKPDSDIIIGTPWYMAPEQAQGHACDERTDLYAVGVILFELLSGTVPFVGETARDVLLKHIRTPAPPVQAPVHVVPDSLKHTVSKLLEKDPTRRFFSAAELLLTLDDIAREMSESHS